MLTFMKTCTRCEMSFPLDGFYADKRRRDGKMSWCKQCQRAANARHYDKAKHREYARERRRKGLAGPRDNKRVAAAVRRWREANPERSQAHSIVNKRIQRGRLIKPKFCELCGGGHPEYGFKADAHHMDYSRPLYIVFCHKQCHGQVHTGERAIPQKVLDMAAERECKQLIHGGDPC